MPKGTRNELIAALQQEAQWTNGDLAREVNRLGTLHGLALRYDRTAVAHWLTGSRPRPPVPDLVADVLTRRLGRLVTVEQTGLAAATHLVPHPLGSHSHPAVLLAEHAAADTAPGRRSAAALPVFAAGEISAELAEPVWLPSAPVSTDRSATALRLEHVGSFFFEHIQRYGALSVRSSLAYYIADEVPRILVAPGAPAERPDVLTALARLSHVQAAVAADSGHPGLAQRYYQQSLRLSRRAGARTDHAITLRALATLAGSIGDDRLALGLTSRALDIAGPSATPVTLSFLLSGRAVVLARVGARSDALEALAAARRWNQESDVGGSPFETYAGASLHYQEGQMLKALGAVSEQREALLISLRSRPVEHRRALALTHSQIALGLLLAGGWDQAVPHARQAFAGARVVSSQAVEVSVGELRRMMTAFARRA